MRSPSSGLDPAICGFGSGDSVGDRNRNSRVGDHRLRLVPNLLAAVESSTPFWTAGVRTQGSLHTCARRSMASRRPSIAVGLISASCSCSSPRAVNRWRDGSAPTMWRGVNGAFLDLLRAGLIAQRLGPED